MNAKHLGQGCVLKFDAMIIAAQHRDTPEMVHSISYANTHKL